MPIQKGDRVWFGEIDTKINQDRIRVYIDEGTIESDERGGYICKPDTGTARYVQANLVADSPARLRQHIYAELVSMRAKEMNRFADAMKQCE